MDENYYPGAVECKFKDAWGAEHTVLEKYPIVTDKVLDAESLYPQEGLIVCELVKEWQDTTGRNIVTVNSEMPWGIETTTGATEFDLEQEQLIEFDMGK